MSHDLYVVVIKNTIVYIDGQNLSNLAGESSHKDYSTSESSTPPTLLDGERQCECIHINRASHTQRVTRVLGDCVRCMNLYNLFMGCSQSDAILVHEYLVLCHLSCNGLEMYMLMFILFM